MISITQEKIMSNWKGTEPLVSIRCITYNQAQYISNALDGFLMQETSFPFEIIVHDDASTDNTAYIIAQYEKKFPEIVKPIYEKENQYSKKDNTLNSIILPKLTGKYTAYCEGDDFWTDKKKLQMQVDFLENNPDYGFCCTDVDIYYDYKKRYERSITKRQKNHLDFQNGIKSSGYLLNLTWLFRTDLYKKIINENTTFFCDSALQLFYEFCLRTKCKYINSVTGVYRRNTNGVSFFSKEQDRKKYEYFKSCFLLILQYLPKFNCSEEMESEIYIKNIEYVLKPAIKYEDEEIIQLFLTFTNNRKGMFLCELYDIINQKEKQIKRTLSYRLGNLLLWPIKKIGCKRT